MPAEDQQPLLNTCPSCQEIIDVSGVRPYEKINCPLCADTIRVRTTFNHFTLQREIGEGGMSRVFQAVDNNLGRSVALKILHSRFEDHQELAAQFEREAKITASINHPNVVEVYSVGSDQGYFYIAMELLQSQSLEDQIEEKGKIPEAEALRIVHEVTLGLAAAMQHNLIHRDIKPGNILLDPDGTAKLVDFGLALMQGAEEDPMSEIWATPFYVPPEKLWNRPEDFRSDIYSLGATLFHMVAGKPPHSAETDSIQELITIKSEPPDLRATAHMHDQTVQLIAKMMAYDPPARHDSYEELLSSIEEVRQKVDPRFRRSTAEPGFPVWARIVSGLVAVGFIAGLAILITGGNDHAAVSVPPPDGGGTAPSSSTPLIVSMEDANLARLLQKGREALVQGQINQAIPLFEQLAGHEKARNDWRAWASFHLGVNALMEDELEASGSHFSRAADLSLTLEQELTDFFAEVSEGMGVDNAPPGPKTSDQPLARVRSLPFALKHWIRGEFPATESHLAKFLDSPHTGSAAWAEAYRPHLEAIQADCALVKTLPRLPKDAEIAELNQHLEKLVAIHDQLVHAQAKQIASNSIGKTEDRIAKLMAASQSKAVSADYALIRQTRLHAAEMGEQMQFQEGASAWRSLSWETSEGAALGKHHAEAWDQAASFLETFTGSLDQYRYDGEILRKEGRVFSARVQSASADHLVVDLGFGPTRLPMNTISAPGLLKIANATLLQDAGDDLLQSASFFAWLIGAEDEARELAEPLNELPRFRSRWEAVTLPLPGT